MKFAHLTDLHLPILAAPSVGALLSKRILGYQSWLRKRRKRHQLWALDALIRDMHTQQCDAALISGDIVNIALPSEFDHAARWFETAFGDMPSALVPGNHDSYVDLPWRPHMGQLGRYMMGWRCLQTQANAPSAAPKDASDFPYIADLPGAQAICVIGVNSSPPTAPALASGSLGEGQLARLKDLLIRAEQAGLYRLVMVHHPITQGVVSWRKGLDDAPALRGVLAETGVDLVIHGHTHFPCLNTVKTPVGDAPVFGGGSASHAGAHGRYRPARYAIIDITGSASEGWRTCIDVRELDIAAKAVRSQEQHIFTTPRPAKAA